MKRTLRHIFSIILVFALLLPLAGLAQAVDATKITLKKTDDTLYVKDDESNVTVTITAEVEPKDYDGEIKWEITDGAGIVTKVKEDARSITYKAKPVTDDVSVTVQASAGAKVTSTSFIVKPDVVQPFELELGKSSLAIGETTTASAKATYASGAKADVTYSSSDPKIAEVNKTSGKITAKKIGTVTITATAPGQTDEKTLTVTPVTFTFSGNKGAEVGRPFALDVLRDAFIDKFGDIFNTKDVVTFSGIARTASGALYMNDEKMANGDTCTFRELSTMVTFLSDSDKDFAFSVSVRHDGVDYSADVIIKSTLATLDLYIPVDVSDTYSFAEKAANGKYGYKIIADAFADFDDFIEFGSFEFDRPSRASRNIGTLSIKATDDGDVSNSIINAADLEDLYFIPLQDSGTFEIGYTAYSKEDGKGTVIATGMLSVSMNAASLDVLVELDSTDPYLFSSDKGTSTGDSAEDLLLDAIDGALGRGRWGAVRFAVDKISRASDTVGTLYRDSSSTKSTNELNADDYIESGKIGDLYFVPDEAGDYEVDFAIYEDARSKVALASGTLTISVANDLGETDFQFVTTVGDTLELDEDAFADFLQSELGVRYELVYITLESVSGGGTFYCDSARFTPSSACKEYYTEYAEDYIKVPKRANYISELSFTAPSKPGITTVQFTAYGVRNNGEPTPVTGVFGIFYGIDDVPVITYNIADDGNVLSITMLDEAKFTEVYKAATGSTAAKPRFSIRFMELPVSGVLYRDYNIQRGSGKPISEKNLDSEYYTIGGSNAKSIATVCYISSRAVSTTDTVRYLAFDANGIPQYVGTINFTMDIPKEVTVSSEGLDFKAADFNEPADPISFVTFDEPTSGKLYVSSGKRLIPVTKTTKLWISDSKAGDQPISDTHYVPKAGETAKVTLTYTAHTKSGATYSRSIIVTPTSKSVSARFSDVKGITGSWAANSVDFASKYGLVQGVGDGKFDPEANMLRRNLILIFYRMAGSPAVSGAMPYSDVPAATDSYSTEIYNSALWASQNGMMDGIVSGDKYNTAKEVTRQEYIRFLYNYTKAMKISVNNNGTLTGFVDADQVDTFATEAMKWAVANAYITGMGNNDLQPKSLTTRAQIVTFLHRYLTY